MKDKLINSVGYLKQYCVSENLWTVFNYSVIATRFSSMRKAYKMKIDQLII